MNPDDAPIERPLARNTAAGAPLLPLAALHRTATAPRRAA